MEPKVEENAHTHTGFPKNKNSWFHILSWIGHLLFPLPSPFSTFCLHHRGHQHREEEQRDRCNHHV